MNDENGMSDSKKKKKKGLQVPKLTGETTKKKAMKCFILLKKRVLIFQAETQRPIRLGRSGCWQSLNRALNEQHFKR